MKNNEEPNVVSLRVPGWHPQPFSYVENRLMDVVVGGYKTNRSDASTKPFVRTVGME
jgi:hypothetical protein